MNSAMKIICEYCKEKLKHSDFVMNSWSLKEGKIVFYAENHTCDEMWESDDGELTAIECTISNPRVLPKGEE